jgi:hypothetical protein
LRSLQEKRSALFFRINKNIQENKNIYKNTYRGRCEALSENISSSYLSPIHPFIFFSRLI